MFSVDFGGGGSESIRGNSAGLHIAKGGLHCVQAWSTTILKNCFVQWLLANEQHACPKRCTAITLIPLIMSLHDTSQAAFVADDYVRADIQRSSQDVPTG